MARRKRARCSADVPSSSAQNAALSSPVSGHSSRSRRPGPRGRIAAVQAEQPVPPPSSSSNQRTTAQQYRSCLDIIGRIAGFSPVRPETEADQRRPAQMIYLTDERGYMLELTLWRQFLPLFDVPRLHEESKNAPVIVIYAAVHVNEWSDTYNVKAISATRFYFDKTIPEIVHFAASLPPYLPPIVLDTQGPPYDGVAVANTALRIAQPDPQTVTISEFLAIPVTIYSDTLYKCVGTIVDLINRYEWHYAACKKCISKLKNRYCYRCAMRRDDYVDWYNLLLKVKDQTDTTEMTALGGVAKIIVGADIKTMIKEDDTTNDDAPQQVLAIIGKSFMFTVLPKESTKFEGVRMNTIVHVDAVPPTSSLFVPITGGDSSALLHLPTQETTSQTIPHEIISTEAAHSPHLSTPPPALHSTTPVSTEQQPSPDKKGKQPAHEQDRCTPSAAAKKRLFSETETPILKSNASDQETALDSYAPHDTMDPPTKRASSPILDAAATDTTQSSHLR